LKLDLTARAASEYPWTDDDRRLYLGGKIMAARILYDTLPPEVEPLSPRNVLVVSTGPLTGTGAPMSSRFNLSTLSPQTGLIASSNCGGDFGLYLKKAGYDAVVITGRASEPLWVEITEDHVTFHEAANLWGKTTRETQDLLGPNRGKLVIGPAGENLVKYAAVFSDERTAGRAGVGAVMGAKNLKALTAVGTQRPVLAQPEKAKRLFARWVQALRAHPITGDQLPRLGTAGLLRAMNVHKVLATRNFKYGQFPDFDQVSGETLAKKYLIKNRGCTSCPVQCGRQVEVHGQKVKGPELETLGLLGPNIENSSLEKVMEWNLLLDDLGLDTISTAGSVAFAMELNERGLWENGLRFGQTENLARTMEDIAYRRGMGDELAEGVRHLAQKYGGQEFAIHSKGLELAAYEPRGAVGQGLGYAVANRGACHLNAGYVVLLEALSLAVDPHTTRAKAELNIMFQDLMEATSSGGNCLFSLYDVIPPVLLRRPDSLLTRLANRALVSAGWALHLINRAHGTGLPKLPLFPQPAAIQYVTGLPMDFWRFKTIGERGFTLERLFNLRRGLTAQDDSLPKRLTDEPQDPSDPRTVVPLEQLKREYYLSRGWNPDGTPTPRTLRRLGLG
jgi:aldehyde:ferredoxin oxidoreductase